MYMIKITGVLAVMIGVVGLLDSWKRRWIRDYRF